MNRDAATTITAVPATVSAATVDSCSDFGESLGESSSVTWCCSSSGYHSNYTHHLTTAKLQPYSGDVSDDDSAWGDDEWPPERPLPLPEWGFGRPALEFTSTLIYKRFLGRVASRLRHALSHQPYDSVSNFIMFAQEYMSSGYTNLNDFYRDYDPPLVPGRYTCVGLAADLASRLADLEVHYPGLKDAVYQVSCEEELTDQEITNMTSTDTPIASQSFSEHVLLCIRIRVEGRCGVVLLDPGYHVSKPITVMEDGLPPQSGPVLTASTRSDITRSYRYYYPSSSKSYVVWEAEERGRPGGGKKKLTRNLIHVSSPYLSGVDVTERRNLAYTFKTLMGRDSMGEFTGGLYFVVKRASTGTLSSSSSCLVSSSSSPEFALSSKTPGNFPDSVCHSSSSFSTTITFLHKVNGEMKSAKKTLAYFLPPEGEEHDENKLWRGEETDEEVEEIVRNVEAAVGRRGGSLRNTLTTLASLLHNNAFVSYLFDLEDDLKSLGEP